MKKLLSLLFIFTFIISGCSRNNDINASAEIDDASVLLTTYKEKPELQRPKSQTPIDNIFIALNELKNAYSYESTSEGTVKAKKGTVTLTNQKVNNKRIITSAATFSESVSISTFVKVAEQLYVTDNKTIKREAQKVTSNSVKWSNNAITLTPEQHLNEYGYSPKDPIRYIINENTIVSDIETTNNGIGRKYSYKFNLDPKIAPYNYKKSVQKLSGSSTTPKFKSIEVELTLDYKWRMTKIVTNEVYEVKIDGIGLVTCHGTLVENFKNINRSTNIEEESFFKNYL